MQVGSTFPGSPILCTQVSNFNYTTFAEECFKTSTGLQKFFTDQIQAFSPNPSEGVIEFLICICSNMNRTTHEKYALMESLASHTSFLPAMHDLLLFRPLEFLRVLCYLNSEVTTNAIFNDLAEKVDANFNAALLDCITALCMEQSNVYRPKKLLANFLNGMPEVMRKDFISHILEVSSFSSLAALLVMLKEDEHLDEFMQAFISQYDNDDFNDSFGTLVEEICSNNLSKRPRFLEKILKDPQNDWICRQVVDDFDEYTPFSQACLLWCLRSEFRKKIAINLQNQTDVIHSCLESIFELEDDIKPCIKLVADLTHGFDEEHLLNFVMALVTSEPPSVIVPYLYSGLSTEAFGTLMLCGPDLHLKLLEHSLPENVAEIEYLAKELNKCPEKLEIIFNQMALTLSENATLIPFAVFMQNATNLQSTDQTSAFVSSFQKVPPFLLAVAMANPSYRAIIFKFINSLSDRQHKAIGAVLPSTNLVRTLETLVPPNLHFNSYAGIVTSLSENNLKTYLAFKNRQLLQKFVDFVHSFAQLQADCQSAFKLKEGPIDQTAFNTLIQSLHDRAHLLNGFITRTLSPDYEMLEKLTQELIFSSQDDSKPPFLFEKQPITRIILSGQGVAYEALMHYLANDKDSTIPKTCSISNIQGLCGHYRILIAENIRILTKLLPDITDDTDNISLEYWNVLTLQNLNALNGIKNAMELFDLGIRSDRDFICLGLSLANKKLLEEIQKKIQLKLGTTQPIRASARTIWEKLLNPKIEANAPECGQLITELVQVYQLHLHAPLELVGFLLSIVQQMQTFTELNQEERSSLMTLQMALSKGFNPTETLQACHQTLYLSINVIKMHELLSVLKRYLSQPNLADIWKTFHSKGCFSLSALGKKGDDLFHL